MAGSRVRILGSVISQIDGRGVPRVRVEAWASPSMTRVGTATSDVSGAFELFVDVAGADPQRAGTGTPAGPSQHETA